MADKWTLKLGCHKGTVDSRDTDEREFDTFEECRESFQKTQDVWLRFGYFIWYAEAIGPNGEQEKLHPGTPYSR